MNAPIDIDLPFETVLPGGAYRVMLPTLRSPSFTSEAIERVRALERARR